MKKLLLLLCFIILGCNPTIHTEDVMILTDTRTGETYWCSYIRPTRDMIQCKDYDGATIAQVPSSAAVLESPYVE